LYLLLPAMAFRARVADSRAGFLLGGLSVGGGVAICLALATGSAVEESCCSRVGDLGEWILERGCGCRELSMMLLHPEGVGWFKRGW
jgi:hypothetical protein